jgi:adenosylcobinamide amidohydrolase
VIYGCGKDRETAQKFFDQPGWKDVDAVRNGNILYFPCDLTCRASARAGYFISCLSSRIYGDEFILQEDQVVKDQIVRTVPLELNLGYVRDIQIVHSYIYDFIHKTLILEFETPMPILSTLEGYREKIQFVGNSYSPPQVWGIYHQMPLEDSRTRVYQVLGKQKENTSLLFTGADMENLSIQKEEFKAMEVYALVTAGVKSNAVRMSKDIGSYYEPGTINIILLSNMKLSLRAMTRAIISATEAKTAALSDMDIRSTYSALINQATGTGTDNILVVQGTGTLIENAGGHTKMGELIAKAVYKAVQGAICKQNGLVKKRNIFERLKERNLTTFDMIAECGCDVEKKEMMAEVEKILLDSGYASFFEAAFAISDDYEQGLVKDLTVFKLWCEQIAENIAGVKIEKIRNFISHDGVPVVLDMAFDAILTGLYYKKQ